MLATAILLELSMFQRGFASLLAIKGCSTACVQLGRRLARSKIWLFDDVFECQKT